MEHVIEIAALLFGFGGGALIHLVFGRKNGGSLDAFAAKMIEQENDRLRQQNNLIEGYNAKHIQRIAELERKVYELEMKIELMEFAPFNIPLPMWQKNQFGVVDYINEEYEKVFLSPRGMTRSDYLGKTDFEAWPAEIANAFRENDKKVLETGQTFNGREDVIDGVGNITKWRIIKFLRKVPRGVAGIAFPDNGYFDTYFSNENK